MKPDGEGSPSNEKAMRSWIRAKRLVNDGEFSKAARDINEAGVARPTENIVEELRNKYPTRREHVKWPDDDEISEEIENAKLLNKLNNLSQAGALCTKLKLNTGIGPIIGEKEPQGRYDVSENPPYSQPEQKTTDDRHTYRQATWVTSEDIAGAVKRLRKSAGGGPQQITPWMLKQAVEGSTDGSCALMIAKLSNRMAAGDFSRVSGRAFSMMRSVALWKSKDKKAVRPIGVGDALKRIIVRAHSNRVRPVLLDLVGKWQLGLMKGGYETGVHVMAALAKQCLLDNEVILLMDFKNAFNACNRNLHIKLAASFLPEIAPLVYWLYADETELFLSNGEVLTSSEGVHQGCGLANLLFALLMQYVVSRIPTENVSAKGSYWDDAFSKSSPAAALRVLKAIMNLKEQTNLEPCLPKFHLYAPNEEVANECRKLFADVKGIKIHDNLNIIFLNTPIGSDEFVEEWLRNKLKDLKEKIDHIVEMPYKMEAFSILRACLSECKVVHLMRSLPPRQTRKFLSGFDGILREGFESLIGCSLEDKWWAVARMNSKYGGMGLKSGLHTAGAQHLTSLVNSADDILNFFPAWDLRDVAKEATELWFSQQLGTAVDFELLLDSVREGSSFGENGNLSLAQFCEELEEKRVLNGLTIDEKLHVESNCGPICAWVLT